MSTYSKEVLLTILTITFLYLIVLILVIVLYDAEIIRAILESRNKWLWRILFFLVFLCMFLPSFFFGYSPNEELGWFGAIILLLIITYFIVESMIFIYSHNNSIGIKIYEIVMSILVIILMFSPFIQLNAIDAKHFIPSILAIYFLTVIIKNSMAGTFIVNSANAIKNKILGSNSRQE